MSNQPQILIVEDEKEIAQILKSSLEEIGLKSLDFSDGKMALDYIQGTDLKSIELFILDRMLPSTNGLEICKFIRMYKATQKIPVLMLTALSTPEQIVEGLDAGADDYITKPFDLPIFQARVRSLLRRGQRNQKENPNESKKILKHKELTIDLDQCKTWIKEEHIELTLSEFKLLSCFMMNPGKVLTRNQLVEYIQDGPVHVTDRTIDTHVFGLRKKLGTYSNVIETIRGVGYRVINEE
ncbi:MAG: response regulator transcription factor [Bacteriovoracaceae bacterium]|jgi:DNA-binding response OmpR family regulator|nr:response regulator transcription factor [Bacteriovoracaceae bacterium]